MRFTVLAAAISFSCISVGFGAAADAAMTQHTEIPPQDLALALRTLATERHFQIVYAYADVATRHTRGAVGEFTAEQALRALLMGTGLTYQYLDEQTITVVPISRESSSTESGAMSAGTFALASGIRQHMRLALIEAGANPTDAAIAASAGEQVRLDEVVVTAQKKEERLQDTPVPISVIKAQALTENNLLTLRDLNGTVPSLSLTPGIESSQSFAIRGISGGLYNVPTVGIVVDDVPYGGSTGGPLPDFDPGDLQRIEVLRGPQGTLYGADSMGGLIKFVTIDPSTSGFSGRIQTGLSTVHNGPSPGYNVRGSANLPVSDTLAVRVSAFTREDPGYIDDVETGQRGVNKTAAYGGHVSALWTASDSLSLKLSALYQVIHSGEPVAFVLPGLGDLQENEFAGGGRFKRTMQAYSAVLKARIGTLDVASVSGFNVMSDTDNYDYSYVWGLLAEPIYHVSGEQNQVNSYIKKFSQEIRLSSIIADRLEWLLGGFYTYEDFPAAGNAFICSAVDRVTGAPVAVDYYSANSSVYREYAAFADLTYHVTDELDVQLGGRHSEISQGTGESYTNSPLFNNGAPDPVYAPGLAGSVGANTYLFTPRYRFTPELMVYARLASGYRPGGPNPVGLGVPSTYKPDTTKNYELGLKGDFLAHTLSVEASAYYIDWTGIQLHLNVANTLPYTGNGSAAKSEGIELSVESRPSRGLTVTAWLTYDDAVLTQSFPTSASVYGAPGDRLPYSARVAGTLTLQQEFPLAKNVTGYVAGSVNYTGDRVGTFVACDVPAATGACPVAPARQTLPAYTNVDLRAGASFGSWKANFFVTNLADRRGILGGGLGDFPPYGFQYIQPRTVGINILKTF